MLRNRPGRRAAAVTAGAGCRRKILGRSLAAENGTGQPATFATPVRLDENQPEIIPPFFSGAGAGAAKPPAWQLVFHFSRRLGRGIAARRTAAGSPAPL